MEYRFKKLVLTNAQVFWLNEILKKNYCEFNYNSLKAEVYDHLPERFDFSFFDGLLVRSNRLTLLGIFLVNSKHPYLDLADKIIKEIKRILIRIPEIREIHASSVASSLDFDERDVEIAFELIRDFGTIITSATRGKAKLGLGSIKFREDNKTFDRILGYQNLDEELEEFFLREGNHILRKKDSSPKTELDPRNDKTQGWGAIEEEYDISKRTFGKKIAFVSDKFKKKILIRDIENAYHLAKLGYSKSAVILAGSVIEELLRLYLISKGLDIKDDRFDSYIKMCEGNRFLNKGISRLSDSVRHFRNLVHLKREENPKATVSKSMAQGAVASIFTVVNDFTNSQPN